MEKKLLIILFLILSLSTFGQQYYVTNQYVYDMFLMNPADAGSNRQCLTLNGYFHKQWFGTDLAPTTQMVTFQAPLKSSVGSGTYLFNDRNGNNSTKAGAALPRSLLDYQLIWNRLPLIRHPLQEV